MHPQNPTKRVLTIYVHWDSICCGIASPICCCLLLDVCGVLRLLDVSIYWFTNEATRTTFSGVVHESSFVECDVPLLFEISLPTICVLFPSIFSMAQLCRNNPLQ